MNKRTKNILSGMVAGAVIIVGIAGINVYNATHGVGRETGTEENVKEIFLANAKERLGDEVQIIEENNDNVLVFLGYTKDGKEGYYEIRTKPLINSGKDHWKENFSSAGHLRWGDRRMSQKVETADGSWQWVYVSLNEGGATEVKAQEDRKTVASMEADKPYAVILELSPEEIWFHDGSLE